MTTPYDFGFEFGRLVKRAYEDDDELADEIAEVRARGNMLDRAPGARQSGNNTGRMVGGNLTEVNGQQQRLSAAQQEDVDAANEMRNSFNGMNASAGGAGRGGMAPQRAAATTPPPASGLPSMSQMFRSTPKPPSAPAATPRSILSTLPSMSQTSRPMPKLPSGPTSSPNFKGAVE